MIRFTHEIDDCNLIVSNGHVYADEIMAMVIISKAIDRDLVVYLDSFRLEGDFLFANENMRFLNYSKYDNVSARSNGIRYSTCGLVWKEYGKKLLKELDDVDDIWLTIDQGIIQAIDRASNFYCSDNVDNCYRSDLWGQVFDINHEFPVFQRDKAYEKAVKVCEARLDQEITRAIKMVKLSR